MHNRKRVTFCFLSIFLSLFISLKINAQKNAPASFTIIPLGVKGGLDESNLSSYMVAPAGSNSYVCLDAGTLHHGIEKAVRGGIFKTNTSNVLRNYIKGYLISHPHLDHISGLVINSPEDTVKNIYGLPFCLNVIKDKYFTWKSWANFGDEGDKPMLKKYHYSYLETDKETDIANTSMHVKAYPLSHANPYQSSAFLIRYDSNFLLYLGDTGADEIEKTRNLYQLWKNIASLVKAKKLKAIFIEVSFPNKQPESQLFGHLTPKLLMREMEKLGSLGDRNSMRNINVVITHMKPSGDNEVEIKRELYQLNTLKLNFVFPKQGEVLRL